MAGEEQGRAQVIAVDTGPAVCHRHTSSFVLLP
jgi:hypothetical protein